MVDRSVKVRLDAEVSGYVSAMGRAEQATSKLSTAGSKATKQSRDWDGLASGLGKFGVAAGLGVGMAVKTFADFDAVMSQVKANSGATGSELDALEMSIRQAGKASVFSATEAAEGANELAKAGMSASDIMGGALTGSLNLAAAGQVSMGRAAEISANAMSTFGLKASDAGHIADVFANGANASTASVDSLAMGLSQSGAVAASFGLSMDETVGVLAQFDQAGLKGSDAGTSLKTMLQALVNPSEKASNTMRDLGINAFDAQGNFVGLDGLAGQLKTSMSGLTQEQRGQAMATIFGSDAVRAANILFKDGAGTTAEWAKRMGESGAAAKLAGANTDNLKGDLEQLKGALEDLLIGGAGGFAEGLRPVVQFLTTLLDLVGQIPAPIMTTVVALTAIAAAGALAGSAGIKMVQGWQNLRSTVDTFTAGASRAKGAVDSLIASQRSQAATAGSMSGGMQRAATAAAGLSNAQRGIVTTSSGAAVQMGRFGTAVSKFGSYAPGIASMQSAFVGAAAGAERFPRSAGLAAASMTGLKTAGAGLLGVLGGPWGLAIAAGATALGLWAAKAQEQAAAAAASKARVSELSGTLDANTGAVTRSTQSMVARRAVDEGLITRAKEYGLSATDVTNAMLGQEGAVKKVNDTLNGTAAAYDKSAASMGPLGHGQAEVAKKARELQSAITGAAGEIGKAQGNAKQYGEAMKGVGAAGAAGAKGADFFSTAAKQAAAAAQKAASDTKAWKNSLDQLGSALLGMRGDQVAYQEALAGANSALKENGKTLDITTEKGRANRTALDGIAAATKSWATSTYESTGSMQQAQSVLNAGSAQFVKLAQSMGMSKSEAQSLASELFKLPPTVETGVNVLGVDDAVYKVDKLGNIVISLAGRKVTIPAETTNAEQVAQLLLAVGTAALSADNKTVTIPVSSLGGPATEQILKQVKGARQDANGNVVVPVDEIGGDQVTNILRGVTNAARTANGQSVLIPASTPNAAKVAQALNGISAAAVTADAKSVTIQAASPMASNVTSAIRRLEGATVSADSKSVRVDTSSPNAANTVRQINGITQSARTADAASAYITVNTNAASARGAILGAMMAAQNKTVYITTVFRNIGQQAGAAFARAEGGPAFPGAPAFAAGGTWDARRGGQVYGAGSRTSDSVAAQMTFGPAALSNYEHVWTGAEVEKSGGHGVMYAARDLARQGRLQDVLAAGVRAGFAGGGTLASKQQLAAMRAWQPSSTVVRVPVPQATPAGAAELARLSKAIDQLPAAVAAASEVGTRRGTSMRESDRTHELRRDLRRGGLS